MLSLFNYKNKIVLISISIIFGCAMTFAQEYLTDFSSLRHEGRSLILSTKTGQKLRVTPYGNEIIRIQFARNGEDFFPNNYYEMVESHDWNGKLKISESENYFILNTESADGVKIKIDKYPMRIEFFQRKDSLTLLSDLNGISWDGNKTL